MEYCWNHSFIGIVGVMLGRKYSDRLSLVQISFQGDTIDGWLEKELLNQDERIQKLSDEREALFGNSDDLSRAARGDSKSPCKTSL